VIRGDRRCGSETVIKVCTEGIVVNSMFTGSSEKNPIGILIIDEAHERSINIDLLLAESKVNKSIKI
jgi:HrpA-like RNA helicase